MDKIPPVQKLWGMINSNVLARCVQVVAEYGVADALADQPKSVSEIAARTGMNADALGRILRLLTAHEVFAQNGEFYRHTPASELLRADHPQSMRSFASSCESGMSVSASAAIACRAASMPESARQKSRK